MGVDFIRKTKRSFHKGLDRHRIELASPKLFTEGPAAAPRLYAARFCSGQVLNTGEKLGVRLDGERVLAMRGLDEVATIASPSAELIEALTAVHGEACGIVKEVHDLAHMAEISVC